MKKLVLISVLSLLYFLPVSAYKVGKDVYLNACGNNPQKYFDKPLNIQNILLEAKMESMTKDYMDLQQKFDALQSPKRGIKK